jgi:hypothetical protein
MKDMSYWVDWFRDFGKHEGISRDIDRARKVDEK